MIILKEYSFEKNCFSQEKKLLKPSHGKSQNYVLLLMKGRRGNYFDVRSGNKLPDMYAKFPEKTRVINMKTVMAHVSNLIIIYNYLNCKQLCTFV